MKMAEGKRVIVQMKIVSILHTVVSEINYSHAK
jgi:hypothetical protein